MEWAIWLECIRIAMREMRRHPTRSSLTMLGIIFGVAALIAVVSISQGANQQIQGQIANLGSNMILVLPESSSQGGLRSGAGTSNTLTVADGEAIERECAAVSQTATATRIITQIVSELANWSTEVVGVTHEYLEVRAWQIQNGRGIEHKDVDTGAKVCVLGQVSAEKLFGRLDPMGEQIRIKGTPFTVIGLLTTKGQSPTGVDLDDTVLVPLSTSVRYLCGPDRPKAIVVAAAGEKMIDLAMEQIRVLLRQRHQIREGDIDDFTVKSLEEASRTAEDTSKVMTTLLVSVAAISLLVGGIGIMNIMLVTVMERTREIGIRMALGASRQMILSQFMIEAVTLAGVGGLLGILVGIAGSQVLGYATGWPALFSPALLITPLVFAMGVGVLFGLLPAPAPAASAPSSPFGTSDGCAYRPAGSASAASSSKISVPLGAGGAHAVPQCPHRGRSTIRLEPHEPHATRAGHSRKASIVSTPAGPKKNPIAAHHRTWRGENSYRRAIARISAAQKTAPTSSTAPASIQNPMCGPNSSSRISCSRIAATGQPYHAHVETMTPANIPISPAIGVTRAHMAYGRAGAGSGRTIGGRS